MTKPSNAPIFLVLAVVCLLITVLFMNWLLSLPNWIGSYPFLAIIPFAGISIFRRERGWIYSVVILVVAAAMILWFWTGGSSSTTTLPVQR
jgi:ABC-type branched-subunit amino acid transport system permease subunit